MCEPSRFADRAPREPFSLPALVTTRGGMVHIHDCRRLRPVHERWPWTPTNDGPGVARACSTCLPKGLSA